MQVTIKWSLRETIATDKVLLRDSVYFIVYFWEDDTSPMRSCRDLDSISHFTYRGRLKVSNIGTA